MDWETLWNLLGPSSAAAAPGLPAVPGPPMAGAGEPGGPPVPWPGASGPPSMIPTAVPPVPPPVAAVPPIAPPAVPPNETIGGPGTTGGAGGPQTPGAGGEPGNGPSSLGEALDIRPAARANGSAQAAPRTNAIADALRGLQAPPRPDVVKPSTPSVPQPRPVQSGEWLQQLNALVNHRNQLLTPLKARTLGDALGIGRY